MTKTVFAILALSLLAAPLANAEQGISGGVSLGYTTIEVDDAGVSFDGSDIGWKIYGRYMFTDNWGVEAGYVDFGKPDDDILGTNVEVDADGFDLFVVGAVEASPDFEVFGKVGVVFWDADFDVEGFTDSDDGNDLALGIGAAYQATDQFAIRGEWEWFDIEDSDTVWMLSVGGEIRFQ